MSQALKTRLNNLAAEVSTLRSEKQSALTVTGADATGSYRIIDSDQKVRFLKVQAPLTLSLNPPTTPSPSAARVRYEPLTAT